MNLYNVKKRVYNNVNSSWILFVFIAIFAIPHVSLAALVVNTDASLGGNSDTINISGQIDNPSDCTESTNSTTGNLLVTIYDEDYGPSVVGTISSDTNLQHNEIFTFGTPFNITINSDELFESDNAGIKAANVDHTGVSMIGIFHVAANGTVSSECHYVLGDYSSPVFTLTQFVTGGGQGTYTPYRFSLESNNSSSTISETVFTGMVASVGATGANIWPLFVLMGVSLAFVIAFQVVFLQKRMVSKSDGVPTKFSDELEEKSFNRGREENKKDGINLFP